MARCALSLSVSGESIGDMEEEFELPDGRKVRSTQRALENLEDHDDCPFCLGRAASPR